MIEITRGCRRDGKGEPLRRYIWGGGYVDELCAIGINQDPEDELEDPHVCERFFWALHDANYNVTGLANGRGMLLERYEYTPYGQRTIYSRGYLISDVDQDGDVDQADIDLVAAEVPSAAPDSINDLDGDGDVDGNDLDIVVADNGTSLWDDPLVTYPVLESSRGKGSSPLAPLATGICDVGVQGKFFDKEYGLYDWRHRVYSPEFGRAMQPDPTGYPDGMNRFEWERSNPITGLDPMGLWTEEGALRVYLNNYGSHGFKLLLLMYADGWSFHKTGALSQHDWWPNEFHRAIHLPVGWWEPWPRWDDSDEEAAEQLYHALRVRYDKILGRLLAKWGRPYVPIANRHEEEVRALHDLSVDAGIVNPNDPFLLELSPGIRRFALRWGSEIQGEIEDEVIMAATVYVGGKVVGKAVDVIRDYWQARKLAALARIANALDDVPTFNALKGPNANFRYFRSYRALKRGVGPSGKGKVWHHIVEQRGVNIAQFGDEAIHNTMNVVAVPREVNQALGNYYSSIRPFTGQQTVRQWLGSQSWRQQYEFGQQMLNKALAGQALP
ncbi:MAG TPA: RHS repeat-associated core domain-containing protein [Planctomycetota bacterium]|nr:RHS repeat-associated core domain-containing protein [Planctomycetota bacterium]